MYSWRVPLTILRGPLRLVASADLGDLGPSQSEHAVVAWRWYYHLPSFAGWALIGALLVLVKENRNRSAWLILIPFLLLSEILWPWIVRLLSLPSSPERRFGLPLQWLFVAWTAVWLLSPWLARRRPVVAFLLVAALVTAVGIAGQFGFFHRIYSRAELRDYLISALALPAAFVLSRWSCRKKYRPRRFLVWLGPWLVAGVIAGWTCEMVNRGHAPSLLVFMPWLAVVSLCFAAILYLLNLPFMYLAFHCPAYRDRFHKLLRLPEYHGPLPACLTGERDWAANPMTLAAINDEPKIPT